MKSLAYISSQLRLSDWRFAAPASPPSGTAPGRCIRRPELVDTDPAACLVIVAKMNALIARYMPGGSGAGLLPARATVPPGRRREASDPLNAVTFETASPFSVRPARMLS